jgi:hypothetical protein
MEHPEMRNTAFGEVLAELLEKRGVEVTPFKVGKLAEDAGLDGWALINRMANPNAGFVGYLEGLAAALELTEPEKMKLALAYTFEAAQVDEKTFAEGSWGAFATYPPRHDYLLALFPTAEEAKAERGRLVEAMTDDDAIEGLNKSLYFAAWVHPELAAEARRRFAEGEEEVPCFHYPPQYMSWAGR